MKTIHSVPPSPEVMSILLMEYKRSGKTEKMTFKEYLESIGFTDPAADIVGMDDSAHFKMGPRGPKLIDVTPQPDTGKLEVKVLLIDFSDSQGTLP